LWSFGAKEFSVAGCKGTSSCRKLRGSRELNHAGKNGTAKGGGLVDQGREIPGAPGQGIDGEKIFDKFNHLIFFQRIKLYG
jgi:hypothetical protein